MNTGEFLRQGEIQKGVLFEKSPNSIQMHLENAQGKGLLRMYPLFPGILISFNRVYSTVWPAQETAGSEEMLLLNYCVCGRCEVSLGDGAYAFVSDGDLSLSTRVACADYIYPTGRYEGLELFVDQQASGETALLFQMMGLDLKGVWDRYCSGRHTYVASPGRESARVLAELWDMREEELFDRYLTKLKLGVLELFSALSAEENVPDQALRTYYTAAQVGIAKAVREIIAGDLRQHRTARDLAGQFGISETSLKNYFRGVYGQNWSAYLRQLRMETAARLLSETKQSIADIAEQVGYENQSKFATAFRSVHGIPPLEYRRQAHLSSF